MISLRDKIRNSKCQKCDLYQKAQSVCLIGDGPYPAEIAFIGEAPGFREDNINKPFSGKAGKLVLDVILNKLDISRKEVYITNAVHCRPPENRTPNNDEIRACRDWLMKELSYVRPKKLVVMGGVAAKSITNMYNLSVKSVVGKKRTIEFSWGNTEVQFTYHPAFILRRPYMRKYFEEHIDRFLVDKDRIGTIVKPYSLTSFLSNYNKSLSIDIEDPGGVINSIAITSKKGEGYWVSKDKFSEATGFISRSDVVIGHNLKHDLIGLIRGGYLSSNILYEDKFFDTLIGWNIIDENCFDKSLKYLSYNYTTMEEYYRPEGEEWNNLDIVRPYNCKDADATKRLYNLEYKIFKNNPGLAIPLKIDLRTLNVITMIEYKGIKVDIDELNIVNKALGKKLKRIRNSFTDLGFDVFGPKSISRPKLGKALRKLGCILGKTDKQNFKTDKKTISNLLIGEDDEDKILLLNGVMDYDKYSKLKGTFIEGIKNDLDDEDYFHPVYFIAKREEGGDDAEGGTLTGRLSAKRFQQIPRDRENLEAELNPRRLFTVRDPKNILISADFSQVEMVVSGILYNEPKLVTMYDSGEDIHQQVASEVFEVRNPSKDQRKFAKTVNFGIVYGISEFGLANRLEWSDKKAKKFIDRYYSKFPGLQQGIEKTKIHIKKYGFVENYFYRRRRLPGADTDDFVGRELIRQGINARVQGTAADITKICMWEMFQRLKEIKGLVVGNVHDELIFEVRRKYKEEVIEWIKEVYAMPPFREYGVLDFPVKLRGEIKVGVNWFKAEEKISF